MKKRAFTLTELLVVVVIIGVLSAVVLPKFTKVLETRKTTEAEAMLMAVRSEQEARCTLDRPYVQESNKTKLASLPENTGSNYTYTLTGSGITASSQSKDYSLRVKSYQDGRICCSGTYCASLNKKYPTCDSLPADSTGCGAEGVEPDPCANGEEEIISSSCGTQKVNVCVNGKWTEQTRSVEWTAAEKSSCSCDTHQATTKPCEQGEGTQTRTETCNASAGLFTYTDWDDSACTGPCTKQAYDEKCPEGSGMIHYTVNDACEYVKDDSECKGCDNSYTEGQVEQVACDCNSYKKVTWHCGADTDYQWKSTTDWTGCRDEQHEEEDCEHDYGTWDHATCTCGPKTCSYTEDECHDEHGIWHNGCCVCTGGGIEEYDSCHDRNGTFNFSTCSCDTYCSDDDINACKTAGGTFNYYTCECACTGNKTMVNGKCVCNASASTKTSCTNNGGTWNDDTCSCKTSSCSWTVISNETDIPTGYLCGQGIRDGETCGDNPELYSGKHGAFDTRPACTKSIQGRTFNYCTLNDMCPGGGIRMDTTVYECRCS